MGLIKDIPISLLSRTFYIDEPLNQAVALCETEKCAELDEYCTHSMLEGLSFKAVNGEGNIVGVMISGVCPLKEVRIKKKLAITAASYELATKQWGYVNRDMGRAGWVLHAFNDRRTSSKAMDGEENMVRVMISGLCPMKEVGT